MKEREVDPVTLAVIWNATSTIIEEIGERVLKAAQSFIMASARDLAPMLFDWKDRQVEIGEYNPAHTAGGRMAHNAVVQKYKGEIYPGDGFLGNDPYTIRGGHLPDWTFHRPVFYKDEIVFWTYMRAHMADTGGAYTGSYFPRAFDIHGEGFIIPPLKVIERNKPVDEVWDLIRANVRMSSVVYMDNMVIFGAMEKGGERLISLCDKYGVETVKSCVDEIIHRTERAMREAIRKIPEGSYKGSAATDWDGTVDKPVWIRVTVTAKHKPKPHLIVDFSESDKQVSFVNMPFGQVYAEVFTALFFALGRGSIPRNEGAYAPVKIIAPEGTVVGPTYPATVGSCACILGEQVVHAIWQALGKAIPEDTPASWTSHCNPLFIGSDARKIDPRTGWHPQLFIGAFWSDGGSGAIHGYDGWNGVSLVGVAGVAGRGSVEWAEIRGPIRMRRYELNPNSEGAGRWRGCFGTRVEYEILADAGPNTLFCATGNSCGELFPAMGQAGGLPGALSVGKVIRDGKEVELPYGHFLVNIFPIQKGDRIITTTGGGGGVGNPLERDIEAVRLDVINELVSIQQAKNIYGVIIDPKTLQVDYEATKKLRAEEMKKAYCRKTRETDRYRSTSRLERHVRP